MQKKILATITILCSIHLWGLYYNFGEAVYFILDGIGFFLVFFQILSHYKVSVDYFQTFKLPILFLYLALFLSTISCYIYHDQNIIATIIAMRAYLYLCIYYFLNKLKIEKAWVERFIIFSSIVYMIVFFTQVVIFPLQIVDVGRIVGEDRGLLRFRIEGAGFLMLSGFLGLNKFLIQKKVKYLFLYIICLVFLFMLGFRTLLITAAISSYILLIRTSTKPILIIKNSVVILLTFMILYLIPVVNEFIDESIIKTEQHIAMGEDYIRYRTFEFYYYNINVNKASLFWGNGFPQEDSEYGKYIRGYGVTNNKFIFQDLGLIGFGLIYGILSLIAFMYIIIKAIFIKTGKNYYYLSTYFLYILLSSFTTVEAYRIGIFGIEALTLYLIDSSKINSKLIKNISNENNTINLS